MSIALATTVLAHAEEHAEGSEGVNPWLLGGVALVILVGALLMLLAFARGREHS